MTSPDDLALTLSAIADHLVSRIEELERRLQLVEEPLSVLTTLDTKLNHTNCPRTHALIAGLIAFKKRKDT